MIYLILRTKDLLEMILIIFWMNLFVEKKLDERQCDFASSLSQTEKVLHT